MNNIDTFFASCQSGHEQLLLDETKSIIKTGCSLGHGGVKIEGVSEEDIISLILRSRLASRVFKSITSFNIESEKDIYEHAATVNWDDYLTPELTFKINTLFDEEAKYRLKNSIYISQLVKDGVVDSIKERHGVRPNIDLKNPDITFLMRVSESGNSLKCELSVDLTGTPLSNRGYRSRSAEAPLRESLAAAIVMSTEWNSKDEHFIDPMCGSGTLLIEAALLKYNIAPSFLHTKYAILKNNFSHWAIAKQPWFIKSNLLEHFKEEAKKINERLSQIEPTDALIEGFDFSEKSLDGARESIERAGLTDLISVSRGNCKDITPIPDELGIIVTNPPYGERVGRDDDLERLYYELGENLKRNFRGYRAYIFTGNLALRKKISLQTSKRIVLYNGRIECRLFEYKLY